jgi:hypothetical protein
MPIQLDFSLPGKPARRVDLRPTRSGKAEGGAIVSSERKRPAGDSSEGASLLSVRALVILVISAVAGILVGRSTDLAVGISTGLGVAVALHAMVAP